MIKLILPIKYSRWLAALLLIVSFEHQASAQTDADAIMIPKNYFCAGAMYSYGSWTNYWEGTLKRNNLNIGRVSTNMYVAMANYGITNRLNVLVSVPYVTTNASAGTLSGMHGFQDLSATIKWMPLRTGIGNGQFSVYAIGTGVLPLSNYVADFMPTSIGIHSKQLAGRLLLDYKYHHFFVTGSGQYAYRSDITIDRNAYYTTELIYSNKVQMPNATVFNFRAGYRSPKVIAEAVVDKMTSLGGFDIRRNDMPFPSNRMDATSVGVNFKYSFGNGLELTGGSDYVVAGRNVGQSTIFHGGAYYLFNLHPTKH